MGTYQKAFLFNGIGSKYEKLTADMPQFLMERFMTLKDETFRNMGLNTDMDKNTEIDKLIAGWVTSSVCDRVIFNYYAEKGIHPDICAGYSSGIGNLSACLGAVDFPFSYEIFRENSKTLLLLREAGLDLDMGVIIGLDKDTVQELIESSDFRDRVAIGSVNSIIMVMISGHRVAVEDVLAKAEAEGALKCIQMHIPIAYHNPFIKEYNEHFREFCEAKHFNDPPIPVISAIDQRIMTTGADLQFENHYNITKPMRWDLVIKKLQEMGVTEIYDVSADCAVKKFSKWNKRKSTFYTYLDV